MTTIAWDGEYMASDSLVTDVYGMRDFIQNKILRGRRGDFLLGAAGEHGKIMQWWNESAHKLSVDELLTAGYSAFVQNENDPALMVACGGGLFRHVGGRFMLASRKFHAVGSGRDYALAALYLGKPAGDAVRVSAEFDNATGGDIVIHRATW